MLDSSRIKKDFPLLINQKIVYLDSAATSQKPQTVIDALTDFYAHDNGPVHRGIYALAERATARYEQARIIVAQFINAEPEEIVFTAGATDGINTVARAWAERNLKSGDEILLTQAEHHANLLAWQELSRTHGVRLKYARVNQDFTLDRDHFLEQITPATRLVSWALTSHIFGDYPEHYTQLIINKATSVGARTLLDAAQTVGHTIVDVRVLGADFLVFSGHKVLGPTGVGVLFCARRVFAELGVSRTGGGMVHDVGFGCSTWKPMPYRLEAGTPPVAQAVGLAAALEYINKSIDVRVLAAYQQGLIERLRARLAKHTDIVCMVPAYPEKVFNHLLTFYSKTIHAHDIAAWCDRRGVCVRAGHHCAQPIHAQFNIPASVRVSVHAYTTPDDIDACADALDRLYE